MVFTFSSLLSPSRLPLVSTVLFTLHGMNTITSITFHNNISKWNLSLRRFQQGFVKIRALVDWTLLTELASCSNAIRFSNFLAFHNDFFLTCEQTPFRQFTIICACSNLKITTGSCWRQITLGHESVWSWYRLYNTAIIERKARVYNKDLFLKAWYSNRDCNASNEHFDTGDISRRRLLRLII